MAWHLCLLCAAFILASCASDNDSRLSSRSQERRAAASSSGGTAKQQPATAQQNPAEAQPPAPSAPADPTATPGIGSTIKDYGDYPKPAIGYVTDLAGLMNPSTVHALDSRLRKVEKETSIEIGVLTIRSVQDYAATGHFSLGAFARGVYEAWGMGNPPKDNGILLLVSARDKECYILFGKYFPASCGETASRILKEVLLPRFKANDVDGAIKACVEAMITEFAEKPLPAQTPQQEPAQGSENAQEQKAGSTETAPSEEQAVPQPAQPAEEKPAESPAAQEEKPAEPAP